MGSLKQPKRPLRGSAHGYGPVDGMMQACEDPQLNGLTRRLKAQVVRLPPICFPASSTGNRNADGCDKMCSTEGTRAESVRREWKSVAVRYQLFASHSSGRSATATWILAVDANGPSQWGRRFNSRSLQQTDPPHRGANYKCGPTRSHQPADDFGRQAEGSPAITPWQRKLADDPIRSGSYAEG
jgi:hypothetical protein